MIASKHPFLASTGWTTTPAEDHHGRLGPVTKFNDNDVEAVVEIEKIWFVALGGDPTDSTLIAGRLVHSLLKSSFKLF
jgi:hypothetical protein